MTGPRGDQTGSLTPGTPPDPGTGRPRPPSSGRVVGGATSKRPTVGPSPCIRLEPQTSVHPRWDRVRLVASRVHDCGARSKLAERPHGTQTSRPADTQVSEARVGPDGFEFADLVHLVEPGKAEGRECPVQLD